MLKLKKLTVLAASLGIMTMAASAQINTAYPLGELIVGFTSLSGNDVVYDLGQESTLTNGKTWNLSTLLASYNLNTLNWGVVGVASSGGAKTWLTYDQSQNADAAAATPAAVTTSIVSSLYNNLKSMYYLMPAAGAGESFSVAATVTTSWAYETITGPLGDNIYRNSYGASVGTNPNEQGTDTPINFYQAAAGGTPVVLGTFTLNDNGSLVFNAVQVAPKIALNSLTVSGSQAQIHFTLQAGSATTFHLLEAASLTGPWTTNATATLTTDVANTTFHYTATTNGAMRFYRVQTP